MVQSGLAAAEAEDEVAQDVGADQGMGDLRVELDGDKGFFPVPQGGKGRMGAGGGDHKTGRQFFDPVAVAHPDLVMGGRDLHAGKQAAGILDVELGLAEFPFFGLFDPAAQLNRSSVGHRSRCRGPGSRDRKMPGSLIGRIIIVDAGRAAGEDDAGGLHGLETFKVQGIRDGSRCRPSARGCDGRSAGWFASRNRG